MAFITEHLGSILLCIGIAALLGGIALRLIKNKRAGRSACSCGCGGCSGCSAPCAARNKESKQ